jgi:hypothetical protein
MRGYPGSSSTASIAANRVAIPAGAPLEQRPAVLLDHPHAGPHHPCELEERRTAGEPKDTHPVGSSSSGDVVGRDRRFDVRRSELRGRRPASPDEAPRPVLPHRLQEAGDSLPHDVAAEGLADVDLDQVGLSSASSWGLRFVRLHVDAASCVRLARRPHVISIQGVLAVTLATTVFKTTEPS